MKLELLKRRCPVCKERGVSVRRYFSEPVYCDSCGHWFKRVPGWSLLWRYALPELEVWLALFVLLAACVDPLSWAFVIGLAMLLGPFIADGFLPLRPTPTPAISVYSRRHRAMQYFLIALPFLQFMLPLVGRTDYETNVPVAVALAAVAVGVIVYCVVLHGRYFFYRGMERAKPGMTGPSALPRANLVFTLVLPILSAGLSLAIFCLQVNRFGSDLRELGLVALVAAAVLAVFLLACYGVGRWRPASAIG
jgi:hypothetical protein